MTMHDEFSGTITLTENSSRELFKVLKEQDEAFINDVFDGRCGFTLKSADGRSVELVPNTNKRCQCVENIGSVGADRKTENSSEFPNNSDTISRQAAISAICNACGKIDCDKMDKCEKLQLPPANCSEFPNNCEHITEDGVTCAKYPACDDCLDNPLNKVKGSERLVKSSEQTEPTSSKMEQVEDEPQTERRE